MGAFGEALVTGMIHVYSACHESCKIDVVIHSKSPSSGNFVRLDVLFVTNCVVGGDRLGGCIRALSMTATSHDWLP